MGRVLPFLRGMLDGSHALDDIVGRRPEDVSATLLFKTLAILHRRGVLVEGPDPSGPSTSDAHAPSQALSERVEKAGERFWARKLTVTRSAKAAGTILRRTGTARVATVTSGLVGRLTVELLGRAGLSLDDSLTLDDFPALDDEPTAPSARPAEHRLVGTLDEFVTSLESTLELADLLVVSVRGATPVLTAALNEVSLGSRTPLIFANEDGERAEISFVDPYRSACLRCRELRSALVSEFALEDYLFSVEDEERGSWRPREFPAGESFTGASLIAAHVAGEAVRYVSRGAPVAFVNRTLTIDVVSGSSQEDSVLRVPRCPACSHATLSATLEEGQ